MENKSKKLLLEANLIANIAISEELKQEVLIKEGAIACKNIFDSYISAGFNEQQALTLVYSMLQNNKN